MWWRHPYFKYITAFILLLITVYFMHILNLFQPFVILFQTLFYPFLIAGFLFYVTRPIVKYIERKVSIPLTAAIAIVFAAILGLLATAGTFLFQTIKQQVQDISNLPSKVSEAAEEAKKGVEENDMGMVSTSSIQQQVTQYFSDIGQDIGSQLAQTFSTIASVATVVVIVPFILFFMLKDGHKLIDFLTKPFKGKKEREAQSLLRNMDQTLGAYIIGQITVATVDGILMYIAYLIIGLDYALVLGLFVAMSSVIPFFGPIIGVIPAVGIALMQDPVTAVYVLLALVIVQQLEGYLVAPTVLSHRLNVHPLTIILLLVLAAPLAGFIGMVIAVPVYAVSKVVLKNVIRFAKMYKENGKHKVETR